MQTNHDGTSSALASILTVLILHCPHLSRLELPRTAEDIDALRTRTGGTPGDLESVWKSFLDTLSPDTRSAFYFVTPTGQPGYILDLARSEHDLTDPTVLHACTRGLIKHSANTTDSQLVLARAPEDGPLVASTGTPKCSADGTRCSA